MKSTGLSILVVLAALNTLAQPLPPLVRQAAPGVYYRLSEDDKKIIATTSWIEFRDFLVVIDANFHYSSKELVLGLRTSLGERMPFCPI